MKLDLRDGIHLADEKGNRLDLTDAESKRTDADTSLREFADKTGISIARTMSGIVTVRGTQADADAYAALVDASDDGRLPEVRER